MKNTTYIIGGSKGIGLEKAKRLAASGSAPVDTVVADLYDPGPVDSLIERIRNEKR